MVARQIAGTLCGLALVVGASGCTTTGSRDIPGDLGTSSIHLISPADREAAPDLSGSLVGGGSGALSDHAGKVVVLNVWASWCGPCNSEADDLVKAAAALPDAEFIGINNRDNEGEAESFERDHQISYPSFFDQDGTLVLQLGQVFPVQAIPSTFILDKQHRIAAVIYDATTAITIEEIAKSLERET